MKMLSAELYKLKKSWPFWVCLLVCAIGSAIMPLSLQNVGNTEEALAMGFGESAIESLCVSFNMPIITMAIALFASIFVSSEFHHGTMKNYVSKGFRRGKIFLTKFSVCAGAATLMLASYLIAGLVSGTFVFGFDTNGVFSMPTFVWMVIAMWLICLAYVAVFTTVGMCMRSNGAAIATNICLVSFFPTVLTAADFLLTDFGITASDYWLGGALTAVATMTPESGAVMTSICVALGYLLVATVGGSYLFKKNDIK